MTRDEAIAAGWTCGRHSDFVGRVTAAYDEWANVDRDLRRYLRLTITWMGERYASVWAEARRAASSEDSDDAQIVFDRLVSNLWPEDHKWMTLANVLRDAVTAYEIYLGKAFEEVAQRHQRHQWKDPARTPGWKELRLAYQVLRLDPRPPTIDEIVQLRDILTHRRGELRTEEDRRRYANHNSAFAGDIAHLTEERILSYLDALSEYVLELDPILWAYSWGRSKVPASRWPRMD